MCVSGGGGGGVRACVSVCISWFRADSYREGQHAHEALEQELLPASGTTSKIARWVTEREKDMKVKQGDED